MINIKLITESIEAHSHKWIAEANEITALPEEERKFFLGCLPGDGELSDALLESAAKSSYSTILAQKKVVTTTYPVRFDLRNVSGQNYITPIKSQDRCGSCVAFGAVAATEGTVKYNKQNPALNCDLSEAHLFFCYAFQQGRNCGTGWFIPAALQCLQIGVVDDACFPYNILQQNCTLCSNSQSRMTRITSYTQLTTHDQMKQWLVDNGPLVARFNVYSDFFSYKSGVYKYSTGTLQGGHCVCCVGYDDSLNCWIMKNSWGQAWGEQGYFRINYGDCGIDAMMYGLLI